MRSTAMEVLRKRPDANEKCNDTLVDDDSQWRRTLIHENQCIPAFMRRFVTDPYNINHISQCSPQQHWRVVYKYSPYNDFDATGKLYLPPCSEMRSTVTVTDDVARFDDQNRTTLILKFEYPTHYRETVNHQAFNGYDLWSQIGGIVGFMIGYSIGQIPETIENVVGCLKDLSIPSFSI